MNWYALLAVLAVVGAYSAIKDASEHPSNNGAAAFTLKDYYCTERSDSRGC
jgi:hypothetical protein